MTRGNGIQGRSPGASSRADRQPTARVTKETTSTSAAATPNNSAGIGRSARPTMPCPKTNGIIGA